MGLLHPDNGNASNAEVFATHALDDAESKRERAVELLTGESDPTDDEVREAVQAATGAIIDLGRAVVYGLLAARGEL